MNSVLTKVTDADFRTEPFFHVRKRQALEPAHYRALADDFPVGPGIWGANWAENNLGTCLSALQAAKAGLVAQDDDILVANLQRAIFQRLGQLGCAADIEPVSLPDRSQFPSVMALVIIPACGQGRHRPPARGRVR